MGIENIANWYQQKIGTYDKQQWETRIEQREQRILYGYTHVQMRSAKPNTDLIDLDLVRGSSFTKAKPQHGFFTVARLATLRCVLLPFYSTWWIQQTSRSVFSFVFLLYLTQIVNVVVYVLYTSYTSYSETITCMEIVIPMILMWVLSLIHSQIVATSPGTQRQKDKVKESSSNRQYPRRRNNVRQHRRLEKSNDKTRKRTVETSKSGKTTSPKSKKLTFNDVVRTDSMDVGILDSNRSQLNLRANARNHSLVDDDGFVSLNGNGSHTSEEETVSPRPLGNKLEETDVPVVASSEDSPRLLTPEVKSIPQHNTENTTTENVDSTTDDLSNCNSCKRCNAWVKDVQQTNQETMTSSILESKVFTTDSDSEKETTFKQYKKQPLGKRRNSHVPTINVDSTCTEDEVLSSPEIAQTCPLLGEITSSTEWMGVTTNSEDCSYSSDIDDVSDARIDSNDDELTDNDLVPTAILTPSSLKVSCTIWEMNEIKKADLSVLDISSAIIGKVEAMPESLDYFYIGIAMSTILASIPVVCRLCGSNDTNTLPELQYSIAETYRNVIQKLPMIFSEVLVAAFGSSQWERFIVSIALMQRWFLASMVFFLLAVAERTFKQRLLYAKLFSHLTSSRRARKSELPHFRLNKVRNIKTWLSVRSYLKKRGPQRSVDVIVSTSFIIMLLLIMFLCVELLKETVSLSQYYLEAMIWCLGLGIFLLRFMTLGTKINKKYRNLSVLITEQINLHLQMEQKPHKKEELNVANNVLKLAIDLLKELESPFKISGLSANPILYNITKLIILSALSGVLSEMLGFKLKLHKIKLK